VRLKWRKVIKQSVREVVRQLGREPLGGIEEVCPGTASAPIGTMSRPWWSRSSGGCRRVCRHVTDCARPSFMKAVAPAEKVSTTPTTRTLKMFAHHLLRQLGSGDLALIQACGACPLRTPLTLR
jgi:hypothetical protein